MPTMHSPPHPGAVLRDGVFNETGLTVTDFAKRLGVTCRSPAPSEGASNVDGRRRFTRSRRLAATTGKSGKYGFQI